MRRSYHATTQGTQLFGLAERMREASAFAYEVNRLIAKLRVSDPVKANEIERACYDGILLKLAPAVR